MDWQAWDLWDTCTLRNSKIGIQNRISKHGANHPRHPDICHQNVVLAAQSPSFTLAPNSIWLAMGCTQVGGASHFSTTELRLAEGCQGWLWMFFSSSFCEDFVSKLSNVNHHIERVGCKWYTTNSASKFLCREFILCVVLLHLFALPPKEEDDWFRSEAVWSLSLWMMGRRTRYSWWWKEILQSPVETFLKP